MVHLNDQHEMELSPAPSYGHSIALCLLRKNPKPLWFWDYFGPVFGPSPSSRCLNMSFEKILRLLGPCIVPGFLRHGICRLITSRRTRINGVPVQVLIHRFCLRACFEMVQNQRFGFKKIQTMCLSIDCLCFSIPTCLVETSGRLFGALSFRPSAERWDCFAHRCHPVWSREGYIHDVGSPLPWTYNLESFIKAHFWWYLGIMYYRAYHSTN